MRDVVAHVLSYDELGPRQLAARFARGRFLVDRTNAVGLQENTARTPPSWSSCSGRTSRRPG